MATSVADATGRFADALRRAQEYVYVTRIADEFLPTILREIVERSRPDGIPPPPASATLVGKPTTSADAAGRHTAASAGLVRKATMSADAGIAGVCTLRARVPIMG